MTDFDRRSASNGRFDGKSTSPGEGALDSETRKKRFRSRLALILVLCGGALLFSPAIVAPLCLDDFLQGAMVDGTFPVSRSPFDLYSLVDDASRGPLMARGLLPWWTDPKLTVRFFRPLSSALMWMDHRVFGHAALPMHLHSLAWWVAAVVAARRLFVRLLPARHVILATAIFAFAPCHALPLTWVANRETLVALTFGALALGVQARWREERRARDAAVSGIMFGIALLGGGEYALCLGGYVVAMDFVRRDPLVRRLSGVMPFALPAVTYLAVRGAFGYGTAAAGLYADPIREPAAFLAGAPWRAVALAATGWLTMDANAWSVSASRWQLAAIVIAIGAALVVPIRRAIGMLGSPYSGAVTWLFWGSLIAFVPTLAVAPTWRLLGIAMLGIAPTVALLVDHAWFPRPDEPRVARGVAASLASLAGLGLGFVHLVHGPGTSFLLSTRHRDHAVDFASRVEWIRRQVGNTKSAKIGVLRGMPLAPFVPFALDPRGVPPARWSVLSMAGHVLVLRRDRHTLELVASPGQGLYPMGEHNLYRKESAPLREGDEVVLPGLRITILEAGKAGPRRAKFVFDEDPETFLWLNDLVESTRDVQLPDVDFGAPFDP